jgi:predicted DNA-binding antitoxin AbrB/MazE fold protein
MRKILSAVYENGVLRPLEPLELPEHQEVTVVISVAPGSGQEEDWLDQEFLHFCASEADDSVTLEAVRGALAKIPGSLTPDFVAERDER